MHTLVACILLLCLGSGAAFEAAKFKKCADSHFCKRLRNLSPQTVYSVQPASVSMSPSAITADILNTKRNALLTMRLTTMLDNTFRMNIVEKEPLHPRFEIPFVLMDDHVSQVSAYEVVSKSETGLEIKMGASALKIQYYPFKISLFSKGVEAMTFNSRNLFEYEHYRLKHEAVAPPAPAAVEAPADGEAAEGEAEPPPPPAAVPHEDDHLWEGEGFKEHKDTKKKGPSAISLDVTFPTAAHVFGLPEHASDLALKTTKGPGGYTEPYRMYNLDVFEYDLDSPFGLYGAVPMMIGHTEQVSTAVFWLNAAEMYIDVEKEGTTGTHSHWMAESGMLDLFFFMGPSPKDIFRQYAFLTGSPAMPNQFAISYHQCRWNYKDQEDVAMVDATFDEHDIPYDVLWLDIEHTDGKKYFTWDYSKFPDPAKMQNELAAKGRKMVNIVDPHIKRDNNYHVHSAATAAGHYVKNKDGGDFDGWCWPGSSSYLDFLNPEVRSFWAQQFSLESYKGSTTSLHIWNDMNEPSVFSGPEVTMSKDNLHFNNTEHRDMHNMYGHLQLMATHQGLMERSNHQERPFVLSRSFFPGSQRYCAIWTGDNMAKWDHLAAATPMLLTLGLTGMTFSGADVGGFFFNPDTELLVRWYQAGAFYPFFRAHAHIETKRREPWLFGEPYTSHIRTAIRTRYKLLPLYYTLFREAHKTGAPVIRPLWVEFPKEAATFGIQDSFLVGSDILVKPVTAAGQATTEVYLPGSQPWYAVDTGMGYAGGSTISMDTPLSSIPILQRGGSIVPKRERARRCSALMVRDPYTLVVALDNQQSASGHLYLDDGKSYEFEAGAFLDVDFEYKQGVLSSKVTPGQGSKRYETASVVERVVMFGGAKPNSVKMGSTELSFQYFESNKMLVVRKPLALISQNWAMTFA